MIALKMAAKRLLQAVSVAFAFPAALLSGFGRITVLFEFFAQSFAAVPGFPGSFLRAAFYWMTLAESSIDVVIGLGSYFSRSSAKVGPNVSIGSYCVIGQAHIGARTQISSHVEIPGGRTQHVRDERGRLSNALDGSELLMIGEDCWLGAGAILIAPVGAQSTIGAGAVVVKEIQPGVVAVGNPARPIKSSLGNSRS